MKSVIVIFGGKSLEHDVSILTGVMTLNVIKEKFNAIPVLVDNNGIFWTGEKLHDIEFYKEINYKELKRVTFISGDNFLYEIKGKRLKPIEPIYCAVNCMHGGFGENGELNGLLSISGIPVTSPSVFVSSAFMDKGFTKIVLKGLGIKSLNGYTVEDLDSAKKKAEILGYPVILKPCSSGSSIGIVKADNKTELDGAFYHAKRFDNRILIEPFIKEFTEINCAAFRGKDGEIFISECEKPVTVKEILTFDDKYVEGKREFPAKIDKFLSDKIKKTTEKIYSSLNITGVIRIDYMIIEGKVVVNEINTVPGSLSYYLFCPSISEYQEMIEELVLSAVKEYDKKSTEVKNYKTGILNITGSKGAKSL